MRFIISNKLDKSHINFQLSKQIILTIHYNKLSYSFLGMLFVKSALEVYFI